MVDLRCILGYRLIRKESAAVYHIMVVDDEPISADGMTIFLEEEGDNDWEIMTCYSAREALQNLTTHIDILVVDVLMPDMNGFELAEQILKRWPMAKVIFITASDGISNVQNAVRFRDAVDYLLKTDDMNLLVKAVRRAITKMVAEQKELVEKEAMRSLISESLPLLRDNYIHKLLHGTSEADLSIDRFKQLQIPLSLNKDVLMLFAKFSMKDHSENDLEMAYFKLENLIQKYTGDVLVHLSTVINNGYGIWLFQKLDSVNMKESESVDYLFSALDMVQQTYNHLGGTFSFVLDSEFYAWQQLNVRYRTLMRKTNIDEGAAIIRRQSEDFPPLEVVNLPIYELNTLLEEGKMQEVIKFIRSLWGKPPFTAHERLYLYSSLIKLFFTYIDKHDISDEQLARIPLLSPRVTGEQWKETLNAFADLVLWISDVLTEDETNRYSQLLKQVKSIIDNNLGGDLSLITMASRMGMSPSYFSKMFKKASGIGYADYVIHRRLNEGARLLKETTMNIADITTKIGYYSSSHFIRIFFRKYGMTPNEYRKLTMDNA